MAREYFGITVTLALANTRYHLLDLLRVIDPNCPATARELTIQSPRANANAIIGVGDAEITAARRAYDLEAMDSKTYRSNIQNVRVAGRYVWSDTQAVTLNVEIETA
jgi:hypothetical protein